MVVNKRDLDPALQLCALGPGGRHSPREQEGAGGRADGRRSLMACDLGTKMASRGVQGNGSEATSQGLIPESSISLCLREKDRDRDREGRRERELDSRGLGHS